MRFVPLLLSTLTLTGCVGIDLGSTDRYQADFHYTFDLKPGGRVNAESLNGSIEITGWDENKVEVTGVKYASSEAARDQMKVETHNTPEMVEIRVIRPSGSFRNMGAKFTMHVPRSAVVDRVTTSNGSIRIRDVASAARLHTSNSSIRAENLVGDLDARTSNGSVDVDSVRGALVLRSSNSRITADNIEGVCDAGTSNGSIELTFRKSPAGDVHAHTNNSRIQVNLPPGSDARVEADTSNSSVRSDFEVGERDDDRKNHLHGVMGKGGPLLELKTSNGGIRISRGTGN